MLLVHPAVSDEPNASTHAPSTSAGRPSGGFDDDGGSGSERAHHQVPTLAETGRRHPRARRVGGVDRGRCSDRRCRTHDSAVPSAVRVRARCPRPCGGSPGGCGRRSRNRHGVPGRSLPRPGARFRPAPRRWADPDRPGADRRGSGLRRVRRAQRQRLQRRPRRTVRHDHQPHRRQLERHPHDSAALRAEHGCCRRVRHRALHGGRRVAGVPVRDHSSRPRRARRAVHQGSCRTRRAYPVHRTRSRTRRRC